MHINYTLIFLSIFFPSVLFAQNDKQHVADSIMQQIYEEIKTPYKGIVYHFYCAVNKKDQRSIAVAASKDLGKSSIGFVSK